MIGLAKTVAGALGKTAATSIVTVAVPVAVALPETVARAVIVNTVEAMVAVGVPEITPVEVLNESPAGSPGLME